jgi:hypothetical protein
MVIGVDDENDENGDDSVSVSSYSQKHTGLLLRTVTDRLMHRRSWLSLDYPPRLQPIQSDYPITIPMPYHMGGGGGFHGKGGGFSGLNPKLVDTEGQPYLIMHIPVRVSKIQFRT